MFLNLKFKSLFFRLFILKNSLILINNNLKSCLIIKLLNLFSSFYLFLELCISLILKILRSIVYIKRLNLILFDKKDR